MPLRRVGLVVIAVLAMVMVGSTSAHEVLQGDQCMLEANRSIEGDLFVFCRALKLDGVVNGNLIGAAYTAEINGRVADGVYLLSGQLDVRGDLGENLVSAGPVLRVHPSAVFESPRADVISLSLSTTIVDGVKIPGSLISLGYQLLLHGRADRVSFWGSALHIDGAVQRSVDATVGDPAGADASQLQGLLILFPFDLKLVNPGLMVTERARIDGLLRYSSPAPGQIEGKVSQDPIFTQVITRPDFTQIDQNQRENAAWFNHYLSDVLREFVTLMIVGLMCLLLAPRFIARPLQNLRWRPLSSFGVGVLAFLMSFVLLFVVLVIMLVLIFAFLLLRLGDLAIIGAMALGVANIGGASVFYFVAIFVSRVLVCLAIGRTVLWLIGFTGTVRAAYISLAIGVALLSFIVWLPMVGWIFNALTLGLGLGAVSLTLAQMSLRARTELQPAAPVISPDLPPPILDDTAAMPGMDNLPQGFKWWSDD